MEEEGKENEEELKQIEYKFILLGDSSVGKSSIFRRLSGKSFTENMISTIGLEKIISFPIPIQIVYQQNLFLFKSNSLFFIYL